MFETPYGHTVVGPTNIRQDSRTDRSVTPDSRLQLLEHCHALYPASRAWVPLGVYAGLRPATQHQGSTLPCILQSKFYLYLATFLLKISKARCSSISTIMFCIIDIRRAYVLLLSRKVQEELLHSLGKLQAGSSRGQPIFRKDNAAHLYVQYL